MMPSPDPLRAVGTDRDDGDPSGMTCVVTFIAGLIVMAFCIGVVVGWLT